MKALILVGGMGTRLRPLTISLPKPLVPFCGLPMVEWQIKALVEVGVSKIVLAIGYKEDLMIKFMEQMKQKYNIDIICSVEKEKLNTGGPLKLAQKYLIENEDQIQTHKKSKDDLFFVLNSDVVCDYPMKEMIDFHLSHKGLATILVTKVENPSRFGIVVHDKQTKKVSQFVEKPKEWVGDYINAGMYIFDLPILNRIELKNVSLEREIFPSLAQEGLMYVKHLKSFWKDIGLPHDFLAATRIILQELRSKSIHNLEDFQIIKNTQQFTGINLIHKDANISSESLVGPYCVIHKNVKISKGCRVSNSVIMDNTSLGISNQVFNSILMSDIKIGNYVRIDNQSIIAEKCMVENDLLISGQKINPGELICDQLFFIQQFIWKFQISGKMNKYKILIQNQKNYKELYKNQNKKNYNYKDKNKKLKNKKILNQIINYQKINMTIIKQKKNKINLKILKLRFIQIKSGKQLI